MAAKPTKKSASKPIKKAASKPTSKSKAVRTDGPTPRQLRPDWVPEKRIPTGIKPRPASGRNSYLSYLDGTNKEKITPNYYDTTGEKVPKQRQTTPYQMSTRPPKRGTNTKRVVATQTLQKKEKRLITALGTKPAPLRTLNKKPERSDPFYNSKLAQKLGHAATEAVYKSNLKDWNNVNKGVKATPNKKPTAAQKKYTATQKLRKTYTKKSK